MLRAIASLQGRYLRFRYRKYAVRPPRIAYADTPGIRAYVNAVRYRKYRRRVLAGVLAYMLARKVGGAS